MKKKISLKGRKKFQKTMKGRVYKQGGLTIFMTAGFGRIGVTCHHSVRGAVNRNRIKRHLRIYARDYILPQIAGKDVVLIAANHRFLKAPITL